MPGENRPISLIVLDEIDRIFRKAHGISPTCSTVIELLHKRDIFESLPETAKNDILNCVKGAFRGSHQSCRDALQKIKESAAVPVPFNHRNDENQVVPAPVWGNDLGEPKKPALIYRERTIIETFLTELPVSINRCSPNYTKRRTAASGVCFFVQTQRQRKQIFLMKI